MSYYITQESTTPSKVVDCDSTITIEAFGFINIDPNDNIVNFGAALSLIIISILIIINVMTVLIASKLYKNRKSRQSNTRQENPINENTSTSQYGSNSETVALRPSNERDDRVYRIESTADFISKLKRFVFDHDGQLSRDAIIMTYGGPHYLCPFYDHYFLMTDIEINNRNDNVLKKSLYRTTIQFVKITSILSTYSWLLKTPK